MQFHATQRKHLTFFYMCSSGYCKEKYYTLSDTENGSNIGVPGVFAFRIDKEDIIDPNSGKWLCIRFTNISAGNSNLGFHVGQWVMLTLAHNLKIHYGYFLLKKLLISP